MHWQPPRVSPAQRGIRVKQLGLADQEANYSWMTAYPSLTFKIGVWRRVELPQKSCRSMPDYTGLGLRMLGCFVRNQGERA
jgi:hypothetical protein